jgi:endonuclease/exonuclease/phosphatase family metal-dependent hydrolase
MTPTLARSLRYRSLFVVVLAVLALFVPAGAQAASGTTLTVMTRNLYLGTNLADNVSAQTLQQFVAIVTRDWLNLLATDFPTRAGALADEIIGADADVVGLQEVTLWHDQTPSDILVSPGPNAQNVVFDFLEILLAELAAQGVPYTAVSTSTNLDAEAPRLGTTGLVDLRITDRDVILVRSSLAGRVSNPMDGRYAAQLFLPTPVGTLSFTRGWASIDYRVDHDTTLRIFNTHLEVDEPLAVAGPVQQAQGAEALALIDASPYPVIALGDFNSPSDGSTTSTYANLTATLNDAWPAAVPSNAGLTCCQAELLDNRRGQEDVRIDLVLTSEDWHVSQVTRTGEHPFRRAPAPLWASDHIGVGARITIPD